LYFTIDLGLNNFFFDSSFFSILVFFFFQFKWYLFKRKNNLIITFYNVDLSMYFLYF
jgi:hypothetical protein